MSDDLRKTAIDSGRALEKRGELDSAVRAFLRVGAVEEAARALVAAKRFADAGQLVMQSLAVAPSLVGGLDDAKKRLAMKAAVCFAQAGDARKSVELFLALGDPARAAEVMERAGDPDGAARIRARAEHKSGGGGQGSEMAAAAQRASIAKLEAAGQLELALSQYVAMRSHGDAARVAYKMKRFADAAQHFDDAGMPFEAAACFSEAGDKVRSLEAARRVPADHPKYRVAMAQAARLTAALAPSAADPLAQGGDSVFPDLPDLPPPPVAPPKAQKTAYIAPMSGQFSAVRVPPRTNSGEMLRPSVPQPAAQPVSVGRTAAAPSASPGDLPVGAIIAERYRVEARIGQGGMATVYRAHDLELGEDIAMKLFLQPNEDPQLVARFKQELTLSRGLTHPNIVRLHDIGQHQGCRFLTMELLQGTDLAGIVEGHPLELARGVRYLVQACSALAMAHDKGVIHRDIKPANFFITRDDVLKVMDFGIAKKATAPAAMTQAGFIAGTPSYMSPEQINNFSAVSHLTDIYALGVVAYEMFTGSVPFDHEEMMQLLMMHLTAVPPPPRSRNPAIPQALEDIILSLLQKDPALRIQSCRELGQRLERLID